MFRCCSLETSHPCLCQQSPKFCSVHLCLFTCTPMFMAALFIIARTWKQPRCPSADEWIRKLWYVYTIEYYSAIKKNSCESVLMRWRNPTLKGPRVFQACLGVGHLYDINHFLMWDVGNVVKYPFTKIFALWHQFSWPNLSCWLFWNCILYNCWQVAVLWVGIFMSDWELMFYPHA